MAYSDLHAHAHHSNGFDVLGSRARDQHSFVLCRTESCVIFGRHTIGEDQNRFAFCLNAAEPNAIHVLAPLPGH